jgi:transposase
MQHVAIDLGSKQSQICARSPDTTILYEGACPTPKLAEFLSKQPFSRVIVETCAEAFTIAEAALSYQHQVRVVPASLVRALGVGEHGLKNDQRDARKLSEMSCRMEVPSVHIPAAVHREHKARIGARAALVRVRTQLVNTVRSYLRTLALPAVRATPETLARRVRHALLSRPEGMPSFVEQQLYTIEAVNEQIDKADQELVALCSQHEICQRLMSIPGIGPVTALSFVAVVDTTQRFPEPYRLGSYLGLVPGERSSGVKNCRTGITRAGWGYLRGVLVQAAWTLQRTRPNDPLCQWAAAVGKRRGKKVASVALARRLAIVMLALWRDGTRYSPALLEQTTMQ